MKVQNPHTNASAAVGPIGTGADARPAQKAAEAAAPDRVRLSGDLQLANAAVRAAEVNVDVRPDAVARARVLLAKGELGVDLHRLADRIVDALVSSYDDDPA
ncbi:MAG: flagellar biosynthesis anti-sigma factor FlgM [Vicinamibacterales bacterium]